MWLGSKVVKSSKNIFKPHLKSSIWIKNLGAKLYNKISTSLTNTSSTNTNLNFKNKHAHALDAPLCFDDAHDDVNYMLNQGKYHIQSAMLVQSCNQAIWSTQFIFNGGLIGCYFTFKPSDLKPLPSPEICWKHPTVEFWLDDLDCLIVRLHQYICPLLIMFSHLGLWHLNPWSSPTSATPIPDTLLASTAACDRGDTPACLSDPSPSSPTPALP